MTRRVTRPDAPQGIAAWWTFDEDPDAPVALDVSGHRLGGQLQEARRAEGFEGRALECSGGCVVVPGDPQLSDFETLSIECRVKTDLPEQPNNWILNRVFGGSETTGFRLGLVGARPCFQIPCTAWSHHLAAPDPLPLGRWVHLAATFDGQTMRLYVDGTERGSMDRPGPIGGNDCHLVLGNYETGHKACFHGLLDDVRLYRRVLSAEEIRLHAAAEPAEGGKALAPEP